MKSKTKKLVVTAMFVAMAYVMAFVVHFPVLPIAPFLKYDPKDVVIVISGFILGPMPALIVSILTSLLEFITRNDSGIIGLVMNAIASVGFCCTAAIVYKRKRTIKGALIGLILGALVMTAVMLLWNYVLTPIYSGLPREEVVKLMIPALLPFNLGKGIINGALTMLLYKPLVTVLRKAKLIEESQKSNDDDGGFDKELKKNRTIEIAVFSTLIIITGVVVLLVINGII